jgi:hypothetical protein
MPGRRGDAPDMFEFVTGRGDRYNEVHVHVRRLPISDIPINPAEIKLWLHNRFVEKDALLETFNETGTFPEPCETPASLGSTVLNATSFLLLNAAVWSALFVPQTRKLYTLTILSSPFLLIWMKIRGFS